MKVIPEALEADAAALKDDPVATLSKVVIQCDHSLLGSPELGRLAMTCARHSHLDTQLGQTVHIDVVEACAHELHNLERRNQLSDERRREGLGTPRVWDDGLGALQRGHECVIVLRWFHLPHLRAADRQR